MASYTVYVPSAVGGTVRRADRTVFVREGFSLAAFFFGPVYLLYRRLWLAAFCWMLFAVLISGLAHELDLSPPQRFALLVLLALLTGFEATMLRQSGFRRRGYDVAAVLASPSLEQAERSFFSGEGIREAPLEPPLKRPIRFEDGSAPQVIGSFPQAGGA